MSQALIGNASLTDGDLNQGQADFALGQADFALGQSVNPSDGWRFFMCEVVQSSSTTADDVVVRPLSSGSPIGDWTLTINPADYGALTDPFNITLAVGNLQARGVTFTLNDFTGTGTLSGVTGLRFTDPNATWDPVSVGVVIVPEPAGFPLAGLGLGLAAWAARRRRSVA